MDKYFDLYNNCKFVKGINNGCLYDTLTGKMFELENDYAEIIEKILKNETFDVKNSVLNELIDMGLGEFVDYPVMHENILPNYEETFNTFNASNRIEQVFIQLVNKCNNKCHICDKSSKIFSKTHCKLWEERNDDVEIELWNNAIKEANNLGARKMSFIGGNPFLNLDKLNNFVKIAKKNGFDEIVVYANVDYMSDEIVDLCRKNDIKIIVQLMNYDECVKKNIIWLLQNNIRLELSILLGYDYDMELNTILQELSALGIKNIEISEYYHSELSELIYKPKVFGKINEEGLLMSSLLNSCLYGKIYISMNGDIMPCPMLNSVKLGSIKDESIVDIVKKDSYQKLIMSSRNKIKGCSKCAFRFNCKDCRAIEAQGSGDLFGAHYCSNIRKEEV